jgi:hypothetical protein
LNCYLALRQMKLRLLKLICLLCVFGFAQTSMAQQTKFNDPSVVVGKSVPADIESLLGKPRLAVPGQRNGEKIDLYGYNYTETTGLASKRINTFPIRQVIFTFFEGKVVGKVFMSTFASDSTEFDMAKAGTVVQGMSKQQVIELLGPPTGEGVYPVAKTKGNRLIQYTFTWSKGRTHLTEKAAIELNESDQVVDVQVEATEK